MDQRVHIVFPQHFSDTPFFFLVTRLYCFAFVSLSLKNVRHASSEHVTIKQTTWHNSSSPDAVFCRNRPPKTLAKTIPKPCVPLSHWQKSPSWLFSYCLLDSVVAAVFLCDGRWRRSRRGGRGFRRSQSSGGPRCRIDPTSVSRSHSQAAPKTPRPMSGTSGRTGPRVHCRCACGLTRPRLAHLAFGCAGR